MVTVTGVTVFCWRRCGGGRSGRHGGCNVAGAKYFQYSSGAGGASPGTILTWLSSPVRSCWQSVFFGLCWPFLSAGPRFNTPRSEIRSFTKSPGFNEVARRGRSNLEIIVLTTEWPCSSGSLDEGWRMIRQLTRSSFVLSAARLGASAFAASVKLSNCSGISGVIDP
jgi:hypothetical protein